MIYGRTLPPIDPKGENFSDELNGTINLLYGLLTEVCSPEPANTTRLKGNVFTTAASLPTDNFENGNVAFAADTLKGYFLYNGIWRAI